MIKCPCFQCDDRSDGCHSICKEYTAWSKVRREQQEQKRNSPENIIREYEIARFHKVRKIKNS